MLSFFGGLGEGKGLGFKKEHRRVCLFTWPYIKRDVGNLLGKKDDKSTDSPE